MEGYSRPGPKARRVDLLEWHNPPPPPRPPLRLRPYQEDCVAALTKAMGERKSSLGVLPTGSGKSLIIAAMMAKLAGAGKRALMLTHVRELVEQDAAAFRRFAPEVEHGIFCRGLCRFELDKPVVFAQTQSLHARKHLLTEPFDVVIVDEAHLIPFGGEGRYVTLIDMLRQLRPGMPIIGLTATPFRLQGGYLHRGPTAWFDSIAYEIGVAELIEAGYLAPLTGKKPRAATIDTHELRIERGDFRESDLAALVADDALNIAIANEIVRCGAARRAWLVFAVGVDHAVVLRDLLEERGITTGLVLGSTPKAERDAAVADFRAGLLRAMVNVSVLTTGFDVPELDLIAVARPTTSTALHVQLLGRGTRIAPGKKDCLVLDFAGNCERLGPITAPSVGIGGSAKERKQQDGQDELPKLNVCPRCDAYMEPEAIKCDGCGFELQPLVRKIEAQLKDCAPLYSAPLPVQGVTYHAHIKPDRPASLRVAYKTERKWPICEWITPFHDGWPGQQGKKAWRDRGGGAVPKTIDELVKGAAKLRVPPYIRILSKDGFDKAVPVWEAGAA